MAGRLITEGRPSMWADCSGLVWPRLGCLTNMKGGGVGGGK